MSVPTISGYDATHENIGHLPAGQVAGYVTGSSWIVWTAADWAAHPGAIRIDQSPFNTALDETADVLDFENGAATLADIASWVIAARANFLKGTRPGQRWPAIYCSKNNVTPVANALVAAHLTNVPLWVAEYYPGEAAAQAAVAAGSGPFPVIGFQYSDKGGNSTYDLDVFSVEWIHTVSGGGLVVTGLKATIVTGTSARISWNRLTGATSYHWQAFKGTTAVQSSLVDQGESAVAVVVTGLTPGTQYSFRVKGNGADDGWSELFPFKTLPVFKPYPAPGDLKAGVDVLVTWEPVVIPSPDPDAGKNVAGYIVDATGLPSQVVTSNSVVLKGLTLGGTYDVSVLANGSPVAAPKATIKVTVPGASAPALTPAPTPSKPQMLGMYQANGAFPTPGPSAWPSGPATNLSATYAAWGQDWAGYGDSFIKKCNANGLVPFVELEPWHSGPNWNVTPLFSDITGGKWDSWLEEIGNSIAGSKKTCILTFAHEFNVSGQYPWAQGMKGSGSGGGALTPDEWIQGWKYVQAKVNSAANGLARWMWAPNSFTGGTTVDPSPWWPGISNVDMVGIDAYPTTQYGAALGTFAGQVGPTVKIVRGLGWTDPIFISETNLAQMVSSGGEPIAKFVADMKAANVSGILEFEDGLPQMTAAQWTEYNTAMGS